MFQTQNLENFSSETICKDKTMVKFFKRRENDVDAKAKTYRAKFLESGLVGYGAPDENQEVIYLPDETILKMADSFRGRPVVVEHDSDITDENFAEKAKGYVTSIDRDADGSWWCDFLLFDEDAIKDYEDNGYKFVSCAYVETESEGGGTLHNIPYSEEVKDGYFTHLALTRTPRYEDARIFENSVSEEERENSKENENMFNIFKKESSGLDMDTLVDTAKGPVSMAELIKTFENSVEEKPQEDKAKDSKENEKEEEKEEKENGCGVEVKAEAEDKEKENEAEEKENEDDTEKKNSEDEKENSEEEEKENESEEEKKNEAEEKKNSVEFFNSLKNARENAGDEESVISLPEDDFKRGSERY